MNTRPHRLLLLSVLLLIAACGRAAVDWPAFMSSHDMVWEVLPTAWDDAPFMGNGTLGTYICHEKEAGAMRVEIGNSMAHDHRPDDRGIYGRSRLLIGHFLLRPEGEIISGDMRLDLWNAETTATVRTTAGEIHLRAYVAATAPLIVVEATPSAGESVAWEFVPSSSDSPRQLRAAATPDSPQYRKDYKSNPAPQVTHHDTGGHCRQPLLCGGGTASAWTVTDRGKTSVLAVTSAHSYPDEGALDEALRNIAAATPAALDSVGADHRRWWHGYYPESFVSIPDKRLENFYWAQIYKLASATRSDGALIDNCGPWLTPTPWPNAWWNLNVQLSYWPVYTSNRLHLGESLVRAVADNVDNLISNVRPEYRHDSAALPVSTGFDLAGSTVGVPGSGKRAQVGCLPWVCHNLWLHYRHSMDTGMLRRVLYPVLRRAVNYYLHFLSEDSDGTLHLATTYSPEYGDAPDCNFDLALLRWGCGTLIDASGLLGIDDPLLPRWHDVLDRLAPFPEDPSEGMMIGRGVHYARSHRHYSHLLMFYPLHLIDSDRPGARGLLEKSIAHWHSIPGNIFAYSFTGAASMYASFGLGDKALEKLDRIFTLRNLKPNTMYKESGPVIETPLSAAQSLHDLLLQSRGGKIRVFPAVPSGWADAAFDSLRAEGAFLVSAVRRDGRTATITVHSLAGEPCRLVTDMPSPAVVSGDAVLTPGPTPGEYILDIKKGASAVLTPGGAQPVAPSPVAPAGSHPIRNNFGSKAR